MKLNDSNVKFNKELHTYHLDGVVLRGITGTLVKRAYPHTYDKPANLTEEEWENILSQAAERGTAIHEALELYEDVGVIQDIPELNSWVLFKESNNLQCIASEYLVTDSENYATAIDHVLEDEDENAVLVDIKTTATLHVQEVTLQLNICRRLFNMVNPDIKVSKMYAVHLRGDNMHVVEVGSIGEELLDALFEADIHDKPFDSMVLYGSLPVVFASVEEEIAKLQTEMKAAKERYDELTKGLYALMEENNVKTFTGSKVKLTRKLPTKRKKFNEKLFKEEHADLYEQYLVESEVKGSILITIQ